MIKTYQLRHDALLLGLPSSAIGQHVAILDDFNPETDEVVIVKRDAKRVWVEDSGGSCGMHAEQPHWHAGGKLWSTSCVMVASNEMNRTAIVKRLGINGNDCIEFVAVKTHRPPETKPDEPSVEFEPIPPETQKQVSEIMRNAGIPESAEAKVKRVYPDAEAYRLDNGLTQIRTQEGTAVSAAYPRPDVAWKMAAGRIAHNFMPATGVDVATAITNRLERKPESPNPARFGITVLDAAPSAIGGVR